MNSTANKTVNRTSFCFVSFWCGYATLHQNSTTQKMPITVALHVMSAMEDNLVKVILRLEEGEDVYVETPWATDLGGGRYRIENCPFYYYNVAFGDIVSAEHSEEEGGLLVTGVTERSGNKLVRIIFENPADEPGPEKEHLDALIAMGCTYEGANPKYICLDIPQPVELADITKYLINNELNWEHAAPSYDVLYPDSE